MSDKEQILNIYNSIEKKRKEMETEEKHIQKLDREITLELERYRKKC